MMAAMETRRWLVKQEPEAYAWEAFVRDGRTAWTGVRNFQARNFLRQMRIDDRVLYYHSVTGKQVVGVARVVREAYPDPTATEGDWSVVDLAPLQPLARPVGLDALKADPVTASMPLIRQSRLSVMPLSEEVFQRVLALGGTKTR
jgi:predicted RNA-binding protein with PUA-like domain